MHYALDHPVQLAGLEKHTQLQLRMAKNAAEQHGEAQTRFAVDKGRRSSLLEDGVRLQAKRASSIKLVERRTNRSEPGEVDDLDQTLAGHILSLRLGSAGLRKCGQLAPKFFHSGCVEHVVFEGVESYCRPERMCQLLRSAGERRPPQRQAPLAQ